MEPPATPPEVPIVPSSASEQIRYAPHLLLIRQIERLDELMAKGGDVLPAFYAWATAMSAWAEEDPIFVAQADALEEELEELWQEQPYMDAFEYVSYWRPLFFGVMKRAGLFDITRSVQGHEGETDAAAILRRNQESERRRAA